MGKLLSVRTNIGRAALPPVVLVVDDDPSVRSLVATIVAEGGYDVLTAAGGAQALQIATEAQVDLLLTDLMMPGMSGSELIDRAKSAGTVRRFLVMSARKDAAFETGAPVLGKPFGVRELLRKIEDVMAA